MKNFAESIAQKIKNEKITPIAPWYFSLKNWIFWISFFIALILGSIAFAMLLVALVQNEFMIRELMSQMLWVPVMWLGAFLLFLSSAWYAAQHTKNGYKIPSGVWIGANIFLSLFLGVILYIIGASYWNDQVMQFSGMQKAQEQFWDRPKDGFLVGKLEIEEDAIVLKDIDGDTWKLTFSDKVQKKQPLLFMQMTHVSTQEKFLPPHPVKLKGEQTGEDSFQVNDIKPFMRGPMREEEVRFMPVPSGKRLPEDDLE